ncbi:hypothetical protein D3C80_1635200 [compost metagenome]
MELLNPVEFLSTGFYFVDTFPGEVVWYRKYSLFTVDIWIMEAAGRSGANEEYNGMGESDLGEAHRPILPVIHQAAGTVFFSDIDNAINYGYGDTDLPDCREGNSE